MFSLAVEASELEQIKYKNLKDGAKITYDNGTWFNKVDRKSQDYFVKKVPDGIGQFSEFYSSEDIFIFSTGTNYEFIEKGALIGYSNLDLKFYEYTFNDGILNQRELMLGQVQDLFPKHRIIRISEFSNATNSLKIKKGRKDLDLILFNDTDRTFDYYRFTTNNSKFLKYPLKGFLKISKRGMIQFSHLGGDSKYNPWFVLLVR